MFYKASLDTRHWSFEAYSVDEKEAHKKLMDGLKEHCRQFKYPWKQYFINHDIDLDEDFERAVKGLSGITIEEIEMNKIYRDREEMNGI